MGQNKIQLLLNSTAIIIFRFFLFPTYQIEMTLVYKVETDF